MKSPYELFMNIERIKNTFDYIDQELEKVTQHSGYKLGVPIAIEIPKPRDKSELNFIKSLYSSYWSGYYWRIEDDYDSSVGDKCWLTLFWKMAEVEK